MEPWAEAYPHRAELWEVRRILEESPSPTELERAQISAAHHLEALLRPFFSGRQFTGIIRSRHVIVENASTAWDLHRAWTATTPSAEAQRAVDRALAVLRQAFGHGLRLFEWDRPGYDEITREFEKLLELAVDLNPPVEIIAFEEKVASAEPPAPPAPRKPSFDLGRAASALAWIGILIAILLVLAGKSLVRGGGPEPPSRPVDCVADRAAARLRLWDAREARRRASDTDPALATLDEAMAAFDGGDLRRAEVLLKTVAPAGDTNLTLLRAELFLLEANCRSAPR